MPGRTTEYQWSRMGAQGQEKNDEMYGKGNSYMFTYRINDARINRFFSPDPLHRKYPHNSAYAFAENDWIASVELEGLEKFLVSTGEKDGREYRYTVLNTDESQWALARFAYSNPDGTQVCFASVGLDPRDEINATQIESSERPNSGTRIMAIGVAPPPGATPLVRLSHEGDVPRGSTTTGNATDLIPPPGGSYDLALPVMFKIDKAVPYDEATTVRDLKRFADVLKDNPNLKMTVSGNTSYEYKEAPWKSGPANR